MTNVAGSCTVLTFISSQSYAGFGLGGGGGGGGGYGANSAQPGNSRIAAATAATRKTKVQFIRGDAKLVVSSAVVKHASRRAYRPDRLRANWAVARRRSARGAEPPAGLVFSED